MGDQVSVSWQGMQQLIDLTRDQYLNLSEASGFMCSGQLANTGAFSGFLGIFRGGYEDALAAVNDGLSDAMTGAQDLSTRIADVRDDLRHTDGGVEQIHTRIEATVSCRGYVPGSPGDFPEVPDGLINLNNVLDIDMPMDGPEPPGWVPGGSTGDPLDVVDNTMETIKNAQDMGQGTEHADDADDYIEEHGG